MFTFIHFLSEKNRNWERLFVPYIACFRMPLTNNGSQFSRCLADCAYPMVAPFPSGICGFLFQHLFKSQLIMEVCLSPSKAIKKRREKCWLYLFTCLICQVVHLEMVYVLETAVYPSECLKWEVPIVIQRVHLVLEGNQRNCHQEAIVPHNRNLDARLQKCHECNIALNKETISLQCKEVSFMGHVLTSSGVKMDPQKARAVQEMPKLKMLKAHNG